jgi:3-hydroxyacyl-[acyl-carrier-protein] dehydratase
MRWFWIDRFTEFEPGKRAVAVKNISLAEEHVHDHFPGYPVAPASLLIEGMAQTAGILVGQQRNFKEKVILAKILKAVFHDIAIPGDQLFFEAVIDSVMDQAATVIGTIRRNDEVFAEISLMFSHVDHNMGGLEFPEENFVFNEQFMSSLKFYLPEQSPDAS